MRALSHTEKRALSHSFQGDTGPYKDHSRLYWNRDEVPIFEDPGLKKHLVLGQETLKVGYLDALGTCLCLMAQIPK